MREAMVAPNGTAPNIDQIAGRLGRLNPRTVGLSAQL